MGIRSMHKWSSGVVTMANQWANLPPIERYLWEDAISNQEIRWDKK